ncbi:MAG: TRAP transporter substrate-binding protein DctP [Desulfatiglandaceae bacterium]|jgi:TRAP-type mannitol/chloroaromatic compound transport system substrate-binding protein
MMKKIGLAILVLLVAVAFTLSAPANSFAKKKFVKFGEDQRAIAWKHKKFQTSKKTYHLRMSDPWGGLLFHDISIHFADSVRAASGGRLVIKVYSTGSIVPAMEIFDATAKGTLDCFHSWPGYWKGRNEAFVAFASVPFGLDAEGYNIWLYERGGADMLNELYNRYGMVAFPGGNAGQELGLYSNKRATKMEDFKGMKIRTPGWYMDILTRLGASVTPLPGSEIYLALERGVIDACEFSCPAVNYPMGFHEITKYVIEPGVHQPSCQFDLVFNKKKYDSLPEDLQEIIKLCAKETQLWSWAWMEQLNIKALQMMGEKVEYVKMDDATMTQFAKTTHEYLEEVKNKYPDVKKVLGSQEQFKRDFAQWRNLRGGVAPWPYKDYINGKHLQ